MVYVYRYRQRRPNRGLIFFYKLLSSLSLRLWLLLLLQLLLLLLLSLYFIVLLFLHMFLCRLLLLLSLVLFLVVLVAGIIVVVFALVAIGIGEHLINNKNIFKTTIPLPEELGSNWLQNIFFCVHFCVLKVQSQKEAKVSLSLKNNNDTIRSFTSAPGKTYLAGGEKKKVPGRNRVARLCLTRGCQRTEEESPSSSSSSSPCDTRTK